MEKQAILDELKRIAEESGGKSPGFQRFSSETGLRKSDWYPHLWLRWGDAIQEAGLPENEFISAFDPELLILKYIELIRELGHFPVEGELRIKAKEDQSFPSHSAFAKLGGKSVRVRKIAKYCEGKPEYENVLRICDGVALPKKKVEGPIEPIETDDPAGIERYWHARFSGKRKEGEWFSLSAADVRAFIRWRKIY
ncbi:MAG: GIY-YIG nuclease family protein [Nitrospira sp.]|nr:GIY-YIG nuclease family protein [Nitrospira sp.]